jgi:hypothetical protein
MKHNEMCKIKILGNIEAFGVKMAVHLRGWMDGWMDVWVERERQRERERVWECLLRILKYFSCLKYVDIRKEFFFKLKNTKNIQKGTTKIFSLLQKTIVKL